LSYYLDFEKRLEQLKKDIELARKDEHAVYILTKEYHKEAQKIYSNLSDYQKLQLARHPERPYSLDYINLIMSDKYEIHGDRHYRDDPSIVVYIGYIGDVKCMVIGEEKGRGTKNKIYRNFGMPHPEGYRKALRCAKIAEKFGLPILMLIDTPGAYPGIAAEERGQSEAIARNLYEFSSIETITVSIVIGEGGSGGALAIGVADKLAMLQYSVFSVISPEGCAAILWSDPSKVESATKSMKITSDDLLSHNLIDDIIPEPIEGAHRNINESADYIKDYFIKSIFSLGQISIHELKDIRYNKLMRYGKFQIGKI
jgi:acetyl-CoA carboxylase carboxyl transferase subunit alpha